jgi:hypothetical protein
MRSLKSIAAGAVAVAAALVSVAAGPSSAHAGTRGHADVTARAGVPLQSLRGARQQYPTFVNQHTGMCLDVNMSDPGTWVQLTVWDCNAGNNQRFSGNLWSGGTIVNYASQKCMDAADPANTNQIFSGQEVGVFPCKSVNTANQNFFYVSGPNVWGKIGNRSGKCVEVRVDPRNPWAIPPRGTKIQLWDCNGMPWQNWRLV